MISNFPAVLQPIIQQGYLQREFFEAMESHLGFRAVADRESIAMALGESVTKTRRGLKAPATTPLNPALNSNFDNGLTPSGWTIEQYTLTMNSFGDTIDLNTVTSRVGLASQFIQNANVNGVQAAQTLDRLARNALYAPYFGGNSRVRTASTTTSVAVDDVRGFLTVPVSGVQTPVSAAAPLTVIIGVSAYVVVAVATDVPSVSTAPQGVSGVLTLSAAVSAADGAAGSAVVAANASVVKRVGGRSTTATLQATDLLTMSALLDSVATLRANAVPTIDGAYNCYLDPVSARQLFADNDFRQLFQGATSGSAVFKKGMVNDFLGLRFMPTTEAPLQVHPSLAGVMVRRPIVVGAGALVEGDFAGMLESDGVDRNAEVSVVDGIAMVTREPLDRLQQIVAQSWYWMGGFVAPSDITANSTIIPTASNASFKRAVIIEHVG